jgi:hypothetical protein
MFVKPAPFAEGDPFDKDTVRVVRDPVTLRALAPEGAEVAESPFWMGRLRDGDVVEADAPLPPGDDKLKDAPASVHGEREKIKPDADGTAEFSGDHAALAKE